MNNHQRQNGTVAAALQGHAELVPSGVTANHYRFKLGDRLVVVTEINEASLAPVNPSAAVVPPPKPAPSLRLTRDMITREFQKIDHRITSNWRAYVAVCGLILLTCVTMAVAYARYASGMAADGGWAPTVLIVTPIVLIALFFAMAKLTNRFSRIRRRAEELQAAERSLPRPAAG